MDCKRSSKGPSIEGHDNGTLKGIVNLVLRDLPLRGMTTEPLKGL